MNENIDPKSASDYSEARRREAALKEKEIKTRQDGVRKGVLITSIIAILILVIAGLLINSHFKKERELLLNQMETQKMALTDKVTARDSTISEWMTTFGEIEKNISLIKEKEHSISLKSSNTELSRDSRQQVLEDMKYINSLLEQNKQKIASLNAQLKKSGGTMKVLESKISELEASVKLNENEISELKTSLVNKKFEVEQLNTAIVVMKDTIAQKIEKINKQTFEMNKAFFVIGTSKELKANGLLTKQGGFIGLGRTKSLAGNFSDSSFRQIDITVTKSFPINAKKAKLISEHPANSYQLILDKDKKVESLEITDPVQFWKISKYAVVEITK